MSTDTSTHKLGISLAIIGAVLLINGAWYSPLMFSLDPSAKLSVYGGEPAFQAFYSIHLAALIALAAVLPKLGDLRGRTGRALPGWLPGTLLVVTTLQIATVYAQAFVVPHLSRVAPAALDDAPIDAFAISMMSIWVAFLIAFTLLGVIGAMRQIIPVLAAILIAIGALSMPMFGPAGTVLIGAGLLYWSLTRILRASRQVSVPSESLRAAPART